MSEAANISVNILIITGCLSLSAVSIIFVVGLSLDLIQTIIDSMD